MIRTELHLRLPNSPGALASVLSALDAERIRVLAFSVERSGDAHLVVDNPHRAATTLTDQHIRVDTRDVIVTTVAPRSLPALLKSVAAAGINVEYSYMSSVDLDGMTAVVLGVDDAMGAAVKAGL